MYLSPEIKAIIARLARELEEIEEDVKEGLNIIQPIIASFPNNSCLDLVFLPLLVIIYFMYKF